MPDSELLSRLTRSAIWRLQRPINRIYSGRHPGAIGGLAIRAASSLLKSTVPNDEWTLGIHAPAWMAAIDAPPVEPLPKPRRIFMYAAYRGQFSMELSLAALLAWRGHRITLAYLPKLRSPLKRPFADHPSAGSYLADALARVTAASRGCVTTVELSGYDDPHAPVDDDFLVRQSRMDSVMALGRETVDDSREEDRDLLSHYQEMGRRAQRAAYGFLSKRRPEFDFALVPNGSTFESANICQVCRHLDLSFTTTEKLSFHLSRVINHGDDFRTFRDLEHIWTKREQLGYVGAYRDFALEQAAQLMNARRTASRKEWMWALQKSPDQSDEEAVRDAGADPARPFALVCTNVPYDTGHDKLTRFFPTMREWLISTVRTLLDRSDLQVIVRCHPGEAAYYGGKERSEDNLAATGLVPDGRLSVVSGERSCNTYGLMARCRFGAVFSSTSGLELAMIGKKVAVGADIYYRQRGFTVDGDSSADYLEKLAALAREEDPKLTPEQMGDARLMYFLLHYPMQWPFPWNKPGMDLRDNPPQALVRSPEIVRYLQTLDALATPPTEFYERFNEFLSVDTCSHLPRPQH